MPSKHALILVTLAYLVLVCAAAAFTAFHWPAIGCTLGAGACRFNAPDDKAVPPGAQTALSTGLGDKFVVKNLRTLETGYLANLDAPARDWALPSVDFAWSPALAPRGVSWERLWDEPPLLRLTGLLDPHECASLITMAAPHMGPSLTLTHDTGAHVQDPSRTSYTALLHHDAHPLVWALMERAARAMGTLPQFLETPQVVRYLPGQQFDYHHDFLNADAVVAAGGQRCKTLFVYLTARDPEEPENAGTTRFCRLGTPNEKHVARSRDAGADGVVDAWCPQGGGLLWRDTTPKGDRDWRTLHRGSPPVAGVKWGLNLWARTKRNARITDAFLEARGYSR